MIPGGLFSAFPHKQFHTLPGLLDSWAALPNSYSNACVPMRGGSLYHFYDGLWYDLAERRTHDLPCERRTQYRLSQTRSYNLDYLPSGPFMESSSSEEMLGPGGLGRSDKDTSFSRETDNTELFDVSAALMTATSLAVRAILFTACCKYRTIKKSEMIITHEIMKRSNF